MSNIGFPLTEFVLETVIRDGLGELRANPDRLDNLFNRFTEAQFNNQYGQTQINKIKTYITNNQIKIVHAFAFSPTVMPCYSIQILASSETEALQNLGNVLGVSYEYKNREVIVNTVTPTAYDEVTGKLTIDPSVDLSAICPGMIFVDNSSNEFTIKNGISNLSGNKFINIGAGQEPDLGGAGLIASSIDFTATNREMIRLTETIRLGVHAKDDIHLAKYLYYILFYILKSRQTSLINRGIHLDKSNVGIFDKLEDFPGENIYSRYMDLNCISEFNWDQSEVAAADCFDLNVYVNDPDPDSTDKRKV